MLLDFSKAFDLVSHNILLHKLKVYKFSEQTLTLFKSYLLDRKQEVRIGKSTSEKRNILADVPQGSVLGLSYLYCLLTISLSILNMPISISLPMTQRCITPLKIYAILDVDNVLQWCKQNNIVKWKQNNRSFKGFVWFPFCRCWQVCLGLIRRWTYDNLYIKLTVPPYRIWVQQKINRKITYRRKNLKI